MQAAETIGKKLAEEFRAAGAEKILQLARPNAAGDSAQSQATQESSAEGTAE